MLLRQVVTAALVLAALLPCRPAASQDPTPPYPTMATSPDPRDFYSRSDTHVMLLGNPLRMAGANIDWLGLRADKGAAVRMPTAYEVRDALITVQALGGTVVRARDLAASVGCALCLMPAPGKLNEAAFTHVDSVFATARDLGLKFILPLVRGQANCGMPDPYDGSLCAFVRARGKQDARAFFTDTAIRADFLRYVAAVVGHVNDATGEAYADNPVIMAWENCDGCGAGVDAGALSAWSEAVGQAVKAADHRHLYENGAFAGRIAPQAHDAAPASAWATASVDIVGDTVPPGDAVAAAVAVSKANRIFIVDSLAWSADVFKSQQDFESALDGLARQRLISGALIAGLQGHADGGGYLPPTDADGLYYPGLNTSVGSAQDMQDRARAFRRFAYDMAELPVPSFLLAPQPEIISAVHGRVRWRGSAGALTYRIERAQDLVAPGAWSVVCDACRETAEPWQDPHLPAGPVWYRIAPINVNGHASPPSEPVRDQ
jgi:hypothetical protein